VVIAVFDSGVGGLSIYQEIKQHCADTDIIYIADNAAYPYGTKSEIQLVQRVDTVIQQLVAQFEITILIIACNSASTLVLPPLRQRYQFPIVGVVPAIKPAAQMSTSKKIGLLATCGTINRSYTDDLIQQFAHDCEVVRIGSTELVELAERKLRGESLSQAHFLPIVHPFLSASVDTVVLACTHFPLLKEELCHAAPNIQHWVDSGYAIAQRVKSLLPIHFNQRDSAEEAVHHAVFTANTDTVSALRPVLSQFGFQHIHFLPCL